MNIYEPLEDNEQDVMAELHYPPEGALTGLFLMGFPSDRIYMWRLLLFSLSGQ